MEHFLSVAGYAERFLFLILAILFGVAFLVVFFRDVTQKENAILRNYPVIGHIRGIAEHLGVYLRQYFYAGDREELPFNRYQREWVYSF